MGSNSLNSLVRLLHTVVVVVVVVVTNIPVRVHFSTTNKRNSNVSPNPYFHTPSPRVSAILQFGITGPCANLLRISRKELYNKSNKRVKMGKASAHQETARRRKRRRRRRKSTNNSSTNDEQTKKEEEEEESLVILQEEYKKTKEPRQFSSR